MHLISITLFALILTNAAPAVDTASPAIPLQNVPLFAQMAGEQNVRGYAVPLTMNVSLHRLFFTFHFSLKGAVHYQAPDRLDMSLDRVPQQYQILYAQLGAPLVWTKIYALHVSGRTTVDGRPGYLVEGTPDDPGSDVARVRILTSDLQSPIHVEWFLRDGYTVTASIDEAMLENRYLPVHEVSDIDGHGYAIHTEMQYGAYALQ
jgi:hypothetical protein